MKVETVAISSLLLDPANARKHGEKNLETIKGSLAKFGQQKPIVIDGKGVVVAGNGTLAAARALGWAEIAAVRTELVGPALKAFGLADNRSSELAEWDSEVLRDSLFSLKMADFDISATGFTEADLKSFEPPNFDPASEDDQGKLDEKKKVQCPECGHDFTP